MSRAGQARSHVSSRNPMESKNYEFNLCASRSLQMCTCQGRRKEHVLFSDLLA